MDVSFISLTKVLGPARALLGERAEMVCLIKPQFEAGKEKVGKKGVVREKSVHEEVITNVTKFAAETGFLVDALSYSPIKGPEGNIEYLMYLKKAETGRTAGAAEIHEVTEQAHKALNGDGT